MKKLVKNAAIIAVGGVITKLLGAVYRIPLTNILGAEGIGLYQMVFPFYCILLTLSSTGIPSAIAKLTASGEKNLLKKSVVLFGGAGLIASLIMYFGAPLIARAQGNALAALSYKTLSPSVLLVSIISCFRGYYQGRQNVVPTALSQIIEQVVKLGAGLGLCLNFGETVAEKAALATLAVTGSEVVALLYLLLKKREKPTGERSIEYKKLVFTVFPIVLSTITLPFSKAVDSFTVVNLLKFDASVSTKLYGLYSGVVESIVAMPVAVCYSLAVSGLPLIAKSVAEKGSTNDGKRMIAYTLYLSAAFAVAVFLASGLIIKTLYPNLGDEYTETAIRLLQISSASVVGLSLVQSYSAYFIGKGKLYVPFLSMIVGVACKLLLAINIVPLDGVGVFGYAFSDIICYFVATICFLLYSIRDKNKAIGEKNEIVLNRSWRQKRGYIGKRV